MIVRFGQTVPEGFLPVFSVDTEAEAKRLLTMACGTNFKGDFVAKELVEEQTFEHLLHFSNRLQEAWNFIHKKKEEQ